MKTKKFITGFFITFTVALIVNILISMCWSYFIKSNGLTIDWETGFRIALLLAIVIPITQQKSEK